MTPIRTAGLAAILTALAACGGEQSGGRVRTEAAPAAPPPALKAAEFDAVEQAAPEAEPVPDAEAGTAQQIAYSHSIGLRLPPKAVDPVMNAHMEACRAAGPSTCVVTNAYLNNENENYVSASLSLRAVPGWIEDFLGGVEAEADAAGGDVVSRQTTAEDLTRSIIDTDARLKAQVQLRDRLLQLLEAREAELGELLDVERELARVNGQIDSLTSTLKAMRLRVSMSALTVSYQSEITPFSPSDRNPLAEAFGGFFDNLAAAVAAVVTAFAFGLPWMLLIGLLLWIWLRMIWPRIRRKKPS